MSETGKESIQGMFHEQKHYVGGKKRILRFRPHVPVFFLSKLLVPGVQIGIEMYLNPPSLWMNGITSLSAKIDADQLKAKLYLCQVRLNPSKYLSISQARQDGAVATYPVVRGDIRTFNVQKGTTYYEANNIFPDPVPNRVIAGFVHTDAFTGTQDNDPFPFRKYGVSSIKQTIGGEEYPYVTLQLDHDKDDKDQRGYHRFLQATGCIANSRGNMVRGKDWGQRASANLFVFDNTANGNLDSPNLHPKLSGNTQLVFQFGAPTPHNLTLIVYGEFENLIEVYGNNAVFYDIYRK